MITASSSIGIGRRSNGPRTPDGELAMYTRRLDIDDLLKQTDTGPQAQVQQ